MLLLAAGCGKPVAYVSGNVTIDGKPVPSGKVAFICEGGTKPVLTSDIKEGRYAVSGVPGGKVTITVTVGSFRFDPVPGMPKDLMKSSTAERNGAGPDKVPTVEVPKRYGNSIQSGLTLTVERSGHIDRNLELTQ